MELSTKEGSFEIEKSPVEELIQQCIGFHSEFDRNWRAKNHTSSFHNQNHIQATIEAARTLISKAFAKENPFDPLNLKGDLQRWNDENPQAQIKDDEFLEVVKLAFAMHDLGNIASGARVDESANLVLDYLDSYKAKEAEARSVQIAECLINNSSLDKEKKRRYLPLIKYLIGQTTFQPTEEDKNKPFAIFSRVVDQIGGNLFNSQENRVFGLIEEMVYEKGEVEINPYYFFNFVNLRLPQLVSDENIRRQIFQAFEKEEPPLDETYIDSKITVTQKNLNDLESKIKIP